MHWELTEEQELFASSLREWIAAKFPTATARELHASGDASSLSSALVGEGWWGVGYSEETGGQGGGVLELALAAREFGRAALPNSSWFAAALLAPALTAAELDAQLSGETRYALATRADRIPKWIALDLVDGRISGTVPHVLGATEADVLVVPVNSADGVVLARVSAKDADVSQDKLLDLSRNTASVVFTDAPTLDLIEPGPGSLDRITALAAVLVAADALGSAERMLELAVAYSKQRKQFGQLIGAFQAVKHAAAQMLVTVEASFSSALYAAAALDAGLDNAATIAAVAKAQVTKGASDLADSALTVHGAIGYTWEHDLHLFYKRAKLDRTLFGSPAAWNERIAAALLDEPVAVP